MAGLALSLALHAALVFAWRHGKVSPQPVAAARTSIAVRLRPPPPPPPKSEPAPPRPSATKPAPAAGPKRRVVPDVIALPPLTPAAPATPETFTVEPPAPREADSAPRFDPDAARKLARQLANDPDPAKAGTALAQLPPKPLATETRAARAIGQAKRRDCKDGLPGGLLAPLFLMMDKKDSGCKW